MAGARETDADAIAAAFAKVIGELRQRARDDDFRSKRYFPESSRAKSYIRARDEANTLADALELARDRLALLERERG